MGDGSSPSHSLRATVKNFDLQNLSPYWTRMEPVDGIVSFHIASTGPLKTPRMETNISVSQGTVFETPFSRASLIGSYDDGQIKGEVVIQRQGEEQLVLSGTFDALIALHPFTVRPEKDPLDALVRIDDLPLALLPIPTSGKLTYDGLLSATVSVTGRATAPKLRGQVALHKGSVGLSNPPLRYDRVEAMVRILPEKLVLQRVYAEDSKGGHLNLQGTLDHQDFEFTSIHLALTGQDSHIPFHRAISATVNPDLILTGPVDAATVKGRLVIEEGTAYVDKFLADRPSDIEIVRGPQEEDRIITLSEGETKRSPLWDGLTIDTTVIVPRNFWIKGRDKNIELSGEIKIKKVFQDPLILIGSVDTVRGTYEFRDKLFKITRGKIAFVGLKEPNPNLDIETVTRIKDVDIILRIVGTAKQPELVLDSRPPMPEADIVSYLVFGRPTDGATTQQAFKAEETALNITGKLAADKLEDILADTFHLDALYIDPGENSFAEGSLSLGKYVSPRVFVTYEHRFQESESPELEISYEINRNLEIETQVGNEETTGADLIWEHEF
jgi:translocation and assembly module TamB